MKQTETSTQNLATPKKQASKLQVFKAVLWSMLGVRQQQAYEDDVANITLKQAVVAGLVGGLIFVATIASMVVLAIKFMQA